MTAYYFIAFILIGSYFFLNFIIGVLFLKYNEAQKAENQGFTEQHLHWMDMQRMIIDAQPDFESTNVPNEAWRRKLHGWVGSNKFDMAVMGCIVLNMGQMACSYEGSTLFYQGVLDLVNYFFTAVFIVECLLKLLAYGGSYFHNHWNRFDFAVVCSSLVDMAMSSMDANSLHFLRVGPQLARVLRVFRVSRVLRLIGKYEGLQALIHTITFSLPPLLTVLGLLLVIFFMFAILGVFFFRDITQGMIINTYMNFGNFGNAMLILFRMSTGEDWNYIMCCYCW